MSAAHSAPSSMLKAGGFSIMMDTSRSHAMPTGSTRTEGGVAITTPSRSRWKSASKLSVATSHSISAANVWAAPTLAS